MRLRPYDPADADAVHALNQGALDGVGPLDRAGLDRLVGQADEVAVVAGPDGTDDPDADGLDGPVAGFALVLRPGAEYASRNYAWFAERFADFHYLDRVVVAPTHRRRGVATMLYDHLEAAAHDAGRLTCEVYSEPPNVVSLAFHAGRGYVEIGQLAQDNGKTCSMLVKQLR